MLNCGLDELRIVSPRDGWPNPRAEAAAVGATVVLERAQIYDKTVDALADLHHVYAATARARDMCKKVVTPNQCAREVHAHAAHNERSALLFGPERTGLGNEDVVLAEKVLQAPLNPHFSSLNLAQAVLLVAYEWYQFRPAPGPQDEGSEPATSPDLPGRSATVGELQNFFEHLEQELDAVNFFRVREKRRAMVQNLRNLFRRAELREQEVRTLHGIVSALVGRRKDGKPARQPGSGGQGDGSS